MTVATDYLAQLPLSLTFLVIAAVWILIALVMIWIGNRLVPVDVRSLSAGGVLNVLAIVASFYGFLVGFVVVQEWGNVNSAKSQVS